MRRLYQDERMLLDEARISKLTAIPRHSWSDACGRLWPAVTSTTVTVHADPDLLLGQSGRIGEASPLVLRDCTLLACAENTVRRYLDTREFGALPRQTQLSDTRPCVEAL